MPAKINADITVIVGMAPRVLVSKPVIGALVLAALIIEFLAENTVLILDAVPKCGDTDRCQGINKACCKTAKAPITQARLRFGSDHIMRVKTQLSNCFIKLLCKSCIEQSIAELTPHQEFSTQIAHGLGIPIDHIFAGLCPCIQQMVADCGSGGYIHILNFSLSWFNSLLFKKIATDFIRKSLS